MASPAGKKTGKTASPLPMKSPVALPKSPAPAQKAESPKKQADAGDVVVKSYTAEEDLKIWELFRHKQAYKTDKDEAFTKQKNNLINELKRSYESVRDRNKKYLKFLTEDDVESIRKTAGGDLGSYYIVFEKDPTDANKKRFKEASKEEPRFMQLTKKPGQAPKEKKPKKVELKGKGARPATSRSSGQSGQGGRTGARPASTTPSGISGFGGLTNKRRPYQRPNFEDIEAELDPYSRQRKVIVKDYGLEDDHWDQLFDVREFTTNDYIGPDSYISVNEVPVGQSVRQEIRSLNECLLSYQDLIQVNFNGDDFNFEFVKKPPIREMSRVLHSVSQLLGVPAAEAEKVYEQVSFNLDDLKAYIGGDKKLLWTSVDDHALQNALKDKKSFERFYPHLVKEKGEASVKKRIEYLKNRKMIR